MSLYIYILCFAHSPSDVVCSYISQYLSSLQQQSGRSLATSRTASPLAGLEKRALANPVSMYPLLPCWSPASTTCTSSMTVCPYYNISFIRTLRTDTQGHQLDTGHISSDESMYDGTTAHTLSGEDVVDANETEPLDDRDFDSHHTHHKTESIPLDDRDFDSHHSTNHVDDSSIPLDDRDFDSHHRQEKMHTTRTASCCRSQIPANWF